MQLAICSAVQCQLLRFCRNHKQHYMASKVLLADMHMVSLGVHAQKPIRCLCTIHQIRLQHASCDVIQICTGVATGRRRVAQRDNRNNL